MAYFYQDSDDDDFIDSEESDDEDFVPSDNQPESEDDYDSDQSDFDPLGDDLAEGTSEEAAAVALFMSKDGKIQYTRDTPPLGRPVGRSSYSNKGW